MPQFIAVCVIGLSLLLTKLIVHSFRDYSVFNILTITEYKQKYEIQYANNENN